MPEENMPKPAPVKERTPDPISDDVVLAAQEGDIRARNRVVLAYLPIFEGTIIRRLMGVSADELKDLRSEGILALYEAIQTWNPEVSKFAPHAYYSTKKKVMRHLNVLRGKGARGEKKVPYKVMVVPKQRLERHILQQHFAPPSPEEVLMKRQEEVQGEGWRQILKDYIDRIPGVAGKIMRSQFREHKLQKDIAKELGLSRSQVSHMVNETLEKMRQDIGEKLQEARINPTDLVATLFGRAAKRPSLSDIEEPEIKPAPYGGVRRRKQ